jgi:hypothetical protein
MNQLTIDADCLYVNGCSWTWGSELRDPAYPSIANEFDPVHEDYRLKHAWPNQVGFYLGLPVVNGSEPGSSNQRMLRTTILDVGDLVAQGRKPLVIIAWSQLQRFELFDMKNNSYRQFVGAGDPNLPGFALDLWTKWSTSRSDLYRWLEQMTLLDSWFRQRQINYVYIPAFKEVLDALDDYKEESLVMSYLKGWNREQNLAPISLNQVLSSYTYISYGRGGHPLQNGHKLISNYVKAQIDIRFKIKGKDDQS